MFVHLLRLGRILAHAYRTIVSILLSRIFQYSSQLCSSTVYQSIKILQIPTTPSAWSRSWTPNLTDSSPPSPSTVRHRLLHISMAPTPDSPMQSSWRPSKITSSSSTNQLCSTDRIIRCRLRSTGRSSLYPGARRRYLSLRSRFAPMLRGRVFVCWRDSIRG